jgi:hypothetical protein
MSTRPIVLYNKGYGMIIFVPTPYPTPNESILQYYIKGHEWRHDRNILKGNKHDRYFPRF